MIPTLTDSSNVELAKFLSLAAKTGEELEMFSPWIDEAWHDKLKIPVAYEKYCKKLFNCTIRHSERSESSDSSNISWIAEYERQFGELNDSWFRDSSGSLRSTMMEEYLWTGEVYASWDCTPADVRTVEHLPQPVIPRPDENPLENNPPA